MRKLERILFGAMLLLAVCLPGSAEDIHFLSIEWLVDSSDYIALAKVIENGTGSYYYNRYPIRISITKTIKNLADNQIALDGISLKWPASSRWCSGDEIVIFCRLIQSKLIMFYQYTLNDLSREIDVPISKTGMVFTQKEDLVKIVEARISMNLSLSPDCLLDNGDRNRGFPYGFIRIFPKINGANLSCSGVIVPPDPEFKEQLISQLNSDSPFQKARAIASLVNYKDAHLVERIRGFLSDSFRIPVRRNNGVISYFPVVQAACNVLERWGISFHKPNVYLEDYLEIHY